MCLESLILVLDLSLWPAMFIKRARKQTLTETFDEAIKVKKKMMSLKDKPGAEYTSKGQ